MLSRRVIMMRKSLLNQTAQYFCYNYIMNYFNSIFRKRLASIPKQPRRVTACGYQTGLQILLNTLSKDYHSTDSASRGFKVFIHHAYDFSDANAIVRTIPEATSAYISILPESTYSTPDVYRLPQSERNCVADNEIPMNTMLHYSYSNCMAECRSNIINELCKCVPFNL